MRRQSIATSLTLLSVFLVLFLVGCDWDGNIYLDETDDTNTGGDGDSDSDGDADSDTDTSSDDPHFQDSDFPNNGDTDWSPQDYLEILAWFPLDVNVWDLEPEEFCGYLIGTSEPEITAFSEKKSFACDERTDIKIENGGLVKIYLRVDDFKDIYEPVIAAATLFVDVNNNDGPPQPEANEDYFGYSDPERSLFLYPGMGHQRADVTMTLIR
ncbi:MAG: hypothetical protein JXX29_04555 [Deltaproteobacteria bacterium]|nr:hypothetical protein [Deltaproteobacteria bacterium]MBN2670916.1 hypothetical protein [Deltaproteobacteria bacterium]